MDEENNNIKKEVRPLYLELQGYLSQSPEIKHPSDGMSDKSIWEQYNSTVVLISKATGEEYTRFSIHPAGSSEFVRIAPYRQRLGGIINYLHGKYFSGEPAPFGGGPSTIITQSQQQNQSVLIQMALDIERKVNEKIGNYEDGSKEKNFMQRLKSSLSSITNVADLITKLSKIANDAGLNLEDISNIFS